MIKFPWLALALSFALHSLAVVALHYPLLYLSPVIHSQAGNSVALELRGKDNRAPIKTKSRSVKKAQPRALEPGPGPLIESHAADARVFASAEKESYLSQLRILLEGSKTYPYQAKRFGEEGHVTVKFDILRDGSIHGIEVKSACPFRRLNEAAVRLVQELKRYRPLPETYAFDKMTVEVPIHYTLND